jgi:hypothetical protein
MAWIVLALQALQAVPDGKLRNLISSAPLVRFRSRLRPPSPARSSISAGKSSPGGGSSGGRGANGPGVSPGGGGGFDDPPPLLPWPWFPLSSGSLPPPPFSSFPPGFPPPFGRTVLGGSLDDRAWGVFLLLFGFGHSQGLLRNCQGCGNLNDGH